VKVKDINGEHGAILKEIHKLEVVMTKFVTTQGLNHRENKGDIDVLFEKSNSIQDRVNELPCKTHVEKFKGYDKHMTQGFRWRIAIVFAVVGMVGGGFSFASAWGKVCSKQERVIETLEKVEVHMARGK